MGFGSFVKKVGGSTLGKMMGFNDSYGAITDPIGFLSGENAAKAQNEQQLAFWRMQNEYNTPAAQMARYAAAGMNPNIIAGQISSGNAGSVGTAASGEAGSSSLSKVASTVAAIYGMKGMKADIANKYAQNANIKQQNSLLDTQTSYVGEQARRMQLENDFFDTYGYWPSTEGSNMRLLRSLFNYFKDFDFVPKRPIEAPRYKVFSPRSDVYDTVR